MVEAERCLHGIFINPENGGPCPECRKIVALERIADALEALNDRCDHYLDVRVFKGED